MSLSSESQNLSIKDTHSIILKQKEYVLSIIQEVTNTQSYIRALNSLVKEVENRIKVEITIPPLSTALTNDRLRDAYFLKETLSDSSWADNTRKLKEAEAKLKGLEATLKLEQAYFEYLCRS
jgi:hypothetical protein